MKKNTTQNTGETVRLAYSTQQVAELVGLHPETVRLACREGRLDAARFGRSFRISAKVLENLILRGMPPHRKSL